MLNQNELIKFEEYLQQKGYADATVKRLMMFARRLIRDGITKSDAEKLKSKWMRRDMKNAINRLREYEAKNGAE